MLTEKSLDATLEKIALYKAEGVEAFCLQIDRLPREDKCRERLSVIFDAMADYPVYATNYMRYNSEPDISYETLEEQLLLALELGATLIDVPADMYHSSDMEFTTDPVAIEKQKALINKIHERGGEVLMSSHVLRFIPKETAYTIALAQKERGADIAKIVTAANTDDELYHNFEISLMLREKLGIKNLFLCGGEKRMMHRLLGPLFDSAIFLVREEGTENEVQPTIDRARHALEYLK